MTKLTSPLSERLFSIALTLALSTASLSTVAQDSNGESKEESGKEEVKAEAMEEQNKPRPNIDTEKNSIQLLSNELEQSEQVWLKADGEDFLALWQKDRTGNPFGAVLILHGQGQTIDEPDEINALRLSLVHHGWATLSINLPGTKAKEIPPRPTPTPAANPENEEAADESENGDAKQMAEEVEQQIPQAKTDQPTSKEKIDPEQLSKTRLDAAIQYLNQQGQYNIVIVGHGVAATRAMKYIQTISGGAMDKVKGGVIQRPIRAIIWVEARNRIPETQDKIQDLINDPNLPILDIYYNEHYLDAQEIKERYRSTRAQSVNHYYQVKMLRPSESNEDNENRLTRRVRGFLNKHAKGVEVER